MGMRTADEVRDIAGMVKTYDESWDAIDRLREMSGIDTDHERGYGPDLCDCLLAIADKMDTEAEERYIPRPTFEDGEVVRAGDAFVNAGGERAEAKGVCAAIIDANGLGWAIDTDWLDNPCKLKGPIRRCGEPDTLERIEADVRKPFPQYWGCEGAICPDCPAMVNGKRPCERYGTSLGDCRKAQTLDLLRRQRELLGGAR